MTSGLYYCRETSREGMREREILAAIVYSHILEFVLAPDKQDYATTQLRILRTRETTGVSSPIDECKFGTFG